MSDEFDYLFLEPLLIDRVINEVSGLVQVSGLPNLQALEDMQQPSPAVYVIYLGDAIRANAGAQGGAKKIQQVEQHWAFVLALSVADGTGDGDAARRMAGPLLGSMINVLTGWRPDDQVAPLARTSRQALAQYHNGFYYYPMIFSTNFTFPRVRSWQPN